MNKDCVFNPSGVTNEALEPHLGWRFLLESELTKYVVEGDEVWCGTCWTSSGNVGAVPAQCATYRTKRPPAASATNVAWHNPEQVNPGALEPHLGWRFLTVEELADITPVDAEYWAFRKWFESTNRGRLLPYEAYTYRTKAPLKAPTAKYTPPSAEWLEKNGYTLGEYRIPKSGEEFAGASCKNDAFSGIVHMCDTPTNVSE